MGCGGEGAEEPEGSPSVGFGDWSKEVVCKGTQPLFFDQMQELTPNMQFLAIILRVIDKQ